MERPQVNPSLLKRLLYKVGLASPPVAKRPDALRIGILGVAKVTPTALLEPVNGMDNIDIVAVGARDGSRAAAFALENGVPNHYGSYDQVLADPAVEALYIPLLNSSHAEWTLKALRAGKHVLVEKPLAVNEEEAKQVEQEARKANKVIFEGFHNRHHPLLLRMKQIVDSGEIGLVKEVHARMQFPWWLTRFMDPDNSPHLDPALGGGNLLEAGCYCVNAIRYFAGAEPEKVDQANAIALLQNRGETGITAELLMTNGIKGFLYSNLRGRSIEMNLRVVGTTGEIYTNNFIAPHFFHTLTVTSNSNKASEAGVASVRSEKVYGASGLSSYRHQLEDFVAAIKEGKSYANNASDAVQNLRAIEMIFDAAGLPRRG